jgi:hypothetical protein
VSQLPDLESSIQRCGDSHGSLVSLTRVEDARSNFLGVGRVHAGVEDICVGIIVVLPKLDVQFWGRLFIVTTVNGHHPAASLIIREGNVHDTRRDNLLLVCA